MSKLVFVIGAGRSGSTLFMNMMNQHSSVVAPPEHDFLLIGVHRFLNKDKLTDQDIITWVDNLWIRKTEFKELWNINKEALVVDLLKEERSFSNIYKTILSHYDRNNRVTVFLDKNPFYTEHLELLRKRFPEALFICLVRDFRDRYVSILRNKSKVFKNGVLRTAIWNKYNLEILNLKELYSHRTYILKYEDLINDTVNSLKGVCEFLKIDFESTTLEYHKNKRMKFSEAGVLNDAVNKMHQGSDMPINTSKIGQWKTKLSSEELNELSFFCNETAEIFGYTDLISLSTERRKEIKRKYKFKLIKGKLLFFLKKLSYRLPWWIQESLAKRYRKNLANKNLRN